jgi:catechol 2,3-dioxygenase-like lactoylglutathione lyase family enzyme
MQRIARMTHAKYGPIDQIGFLVDDLDASVSHWTDMLGVGPWLVFRNVTLDGVYRGVASVVTMDVALGYQGDVQIELIKATNNAPSPYRSDDGAAILGVHHMAWVVDDLDAAIARATGDGLEIVFRASNPATDVAYLRMPDAPGMLFEFITGPGMREMMTAGIAATREWDGQNPVTEIDAAG